MFVVSNLCKDSDNLLYKVLLFITISGIYSVCEIIPPTGGVIQIRDISLYLSAKS